MATKTGSGVKQVLEDTGCPKGNVRYSADWPPTCAQTLVPRTDPNTTKTFSARAGLYAYGV